MGGEAFVAAGVPHVVAVRREAQLQDKAACAFADQFYFALFKGRTVQSAFDIARQAVSNDPAILRAEHESDKFLLLPANADHGVALCRGLADGPLVDLSLATTLSTISPPSSRCSLSGGRPSGSSWSRRPSGRRSDFSPSSARAAWARPRWPWQRRTTCTRGPLTRGA